MRQEAGPWTHLDPVAIDVASACTLITLAYQSIVMLLLLLLLLLSPFSLPGWV